jgi:hypothetical protein
MIPTGEAFVNSGESNGETKCLTGFAFFAVAGIPRQFGSVKEIAGYLGYLLRRC